MPKVMKPPAEYSEDSIDTGFEQYDGPPPTPGLYKGKVKKLLLSKIESGEKKDQQNILVICDITEGKFKGAGVAKWLQLTEQGSPWVNQFLRALTDGTDDAFARMRAGFKKGYAVEGPDSKKRYSIEMFANKFVPLGRDINFFVTQRTIEGGERDGETVAQIARFVTPVNGSVDDDEPDADDTFGEALADVAGDDDISSDDVVAEEDSVPADDDPTSSADEDDPWSVDA